MIPKKNTPKKKKKRKKAKPRKKSHAPRHAKKNKIRRLHKQRPSRAPATVATYQKKGEKTFQNKSNATKKKRKREP